MNDILSPGTILRLRKAFKSTPLWLNRIGEEFEVLPYSEQDGCNVVWLKSRKSGGIETTDQSDALFYFEVIVEAASDSK